MSDKSFSLSEDWVVVILGLGIIALALCGVVLPVPHFDWTNTTQFTQSVFPRQI